jgi:hypothetical protein
MFYLLRLYQMMASQNGMTNNGLYLLVQVIDNYALNEMLFYE